MLVKELVYMILDSVKSISDDSIFNEEHVLFLCKKYRSFLIKKEQEKEKATADMASEFEYQQICLDLEKVAAIDGAPCTGGYYLRKLRLSAVFEDFDEVMGLQCDDEGNTDGVACDVLDGTFPIREYLVPMLIELVVKELTQAIYKPADTRNNAADDTSKLVAQNNR